MKIAILGYDVEGRSSFDYFSAQGHDLTICDRDTSIRVPDGIPSVLGDSYLDDLDRFDLLVRTAGLPPQAILDRNPDVADKITSHINEFLKVCPTKKVIGVTGTKGKGTTSTLIARMLEATGEKVRLGGNIGVPPLNFLPELTPDAWVVLELSSFQLTDLKISPHIAICLMVVPEHLDWHRDADEYTKAKSQLFAHQSPEDIAIYFSDSKASEQIAGVSPGRKIPYYTQPGGHMEKDQIVIDGQAICPVSEVKLLGRHNLQNVCAAVTAVWQVNKDIPALRGAIGAFSGLPYRLEFRKETHGIRYYNDSFAATPPAPAAALTAIPGKKVLIVGGYERGLELKELAEAVRSNSASLREILLIGASAQRVAGALKKEGFADYTLSKAKDMAGIVSEATGLARPGDAVVLSPGFPSFDMFKNFEDRGNQFNEAVDEL